MKDTDATDPALLPRDPQSGEPIAPVEQPGYYSGFHTLSQQAFWDETTRKVVTERVSQPPSIRHFTPGDVRFWTVVFDHLIPQSDRKPDRRISIVPSIDFRLFTNRTIGYRFEDMPPDREAYQLGQQAIDEEAQHRYGATLVSLPQRQQDLVLKAIHDGESKAAVAIWKHMSIHRFWQFLMQDAIDAYYAHPWAWDEIGFGGPAYPRGYIRLERGEPEPWEVQEQRYDWIAPANSVSDHVEEARDFHTEALQHRSHTKVR